MKFPKLCLALLFLCAAGGAVIGAPYGPDGKLAEFTQPDGTKISLRVLGDEFYARTETLDGYTVVFDPAFKAYFYARLSADGQRLESTSVMVGAITPKATMPEKHVALDPAVIAAQARAARTEWEQDTGVRERWESLKAQRRSLDSGGPSVKAPPSFPTLGNKTGLTLLVDFSDDPAAVPQAEIINFLNGDAYTGYGNNGSVKKYFLDNSDNKLTYSNVVTAYVRMARPKSYYDNLSIDCGTQGRKLIVDALAILKALPNYTSDILPLFDSLTVDSSNRVVACNVYFAGDNSGVWSQGLWPHSWVLASPVELSPGGKKVYSYQITDIGSGLELGTFCHENGHMLCDYPDIYDYDYDSVGGAGIFCLMNSGGHGTNPVLICAYLKNASGWATITDIDKAAGVRSGTLVAGLGQTGYNHFYRYRKPGVATEYFLLENRQKSGRDANLPASGIAIWHVDELGDHDNQSMSPNTTHANYEVTLEQADNLWHFQRDVNSGDANDLYYLGNKATAYSNTFNDSSSPNAKWWDGSDSGLKLKNFSISGPVMTFAVDLFVSPPNVRIVSPANGAYILPGSGVAVKVDAFDSNGSVTQVDLFVNDVFYETRTVFPFDFFYTPSLLGSYVLKAVATDNDGESAEDVVSFEYRYPPPGTLRQNFIPPSANDHVQALAADPQGRIYVGGLFTMLDDAAAPRIGRLGADGSVDASFFVGTGPDAQVRALLHVAQDKGLYVGGHFANFDGTSRRALVRLRTGQAGLVDGSLDPSFAPVFEGSSSSAPPYVRSLARQSDGKILVGGFFAKVNSTNRANLARLNPDGTLDTSFAPNPGGAVHCIALQADGKILVGGSFTQIAGHTSRRIARLLPDGTLDTSFVTGTSTTSGGFDGAVNSIAVTLDGEVIAGGAFTSYNGRGYYNNMAKLLPTGAVDGKFNFTPGVNGVVNDLHLRPSGQILVSGLFTQVANNVLGIAATTVGRVVQMNSTGAENGTLDAGFNPGQTGADGSVLDSITLPDGDILLAGAFTSFNGEPRARLAVISGYDQSVPIVVSAPFHNIDAGVDLDFPFLASGEGPYSYSLTGPLPRGVTFDSATGALRGVPLDAGRYELEVVATSATGTTQATRFVLNVNDKKVPYAQWKRAWFSPAEQANEAVSGRGAVRNSAGLSNVLVYALGGGDPDAADASLVPVVQREKIGTKYYLTLTAPKYPAADATYLVECSGDLANWGWSNPADVVTISEDTTQLKARAATPATEIGKQFLRLKVLAP